jgi:hypothetical protein
LKYWYFPGSFGLELPVLPGIDFQEISQTGASGENGMNWP